MGANVFGEFMGTAVLILLGDGVVANVLLNIAFAMVALSSLSYLGLGVAPGSPDWGRQLADGQQIMGDNPLAAVLPGVLIILAATSVNLLGDWLAEHLDRKVATR